MNGLDWVLLVLLGVATLWGLRRGFIGAFVPMVGLIVGVFLAGLLYAPVAESVLNSESAIAKVGAFIIVLVAVMVVTSLVGRMLTGLVSLMFLGWANRLAGGAFGLVLGGVALGALLAMVTRFPLLGLDSVAQDSSLAAFLVERFPLVLSLLPDEFDPLRSFFR